MKPRTTTTGSPRRTAALGVVALTLTVGVTGAAYALAAADRPAADVTAGDAERPEPAGDALLATADPVDEPSGGRTVPPAPAGAEEYTQERWEAFFGAGYYMEDAFALAELWDVEVLEAKGRAGQMLLDGQPVPVAPGSSLDLTDPETIRGLQLEAFWDAGYTGGDGVTLAEMWNVEIGEAKAAAGQMLRNGQSLPIGPSGTPLP